MRPPPTGGGLGGRPNSEQDLQPAPPAHRVEGKRLLKLEADLYLETENGVVVIAFAPFTEGMKKWKQVAMAMAPGLAWWKAFRQRLDSLESSDRVVECWLVFGIEGQGVEISI